MPSFNAIAAPLMTPGGVTSGLTDLVSALVRAPMQRRQIEQDQANQVATQEQAAREFAFRQQAHGDDMGLSRDRLAQDGSQFKTSERRMSLAEALQHLRGGKNGHGAGNQFTFEDAYRDAGEKASIPNPDKSVAAQAMNPTVTVMRTPTERAELARQALAANAASSGAAGGVVPIDQALPGGSTDPSAAMIRELMVNSGGVPTDMTMGMGASAAPASAADPATAQAAAAPVAPARPAFAGTSTSSAVEYLTQYGPAGKPYASMTAEQLQAELDALN